jgi:hypothetical protein
MNRQLKISGLHLPLFFFRQKSMSTCIVPWETAAKQEDYESTKASYQG